MWLKLGLTIEDEETYKISWKWSKERIEGLGQTIKTKAKINYFF